MSYAEQMREVASLFHSGRLDEGIVAYAIVRRNSGITDLINARSWDEHQMAIGRINEAASFKSISDAITRLTAEENPK